MVPLQEPISLEPPDRADMTMQSQAAAGSLDDTDAADRLPRCMVVEDEVLIALMIEDCLEDGGYGSVGPFRSGSEALAWLQTGTPQAAILDFSLSDGACSRLAAELARRGIPFLIHSGHRPGDLPPEIQGAPRIEKPSTRNDLMAALRLILEPIHDADRSRPGSAPWYPDAAP
jgi:DNA-binding response OmpR family regulator